MVCLSLNIVVYWKLWAKKKEKGGITLLLLSEVSAFSVQAKREVVPLPASFGVHSHSLLHPLAKVKMCVWCPCHDGT